MAIMVEPEGGGRVCCDCKEWQKADQYSWQKSRTAPGRTYRGSVCKKCRARRCREWGKKNKDRAKNTRLLRMHGITKADYDAMLADQGGVCAICGLPEAKNRDPRTNSFKSLCVDHDHRTGNVRGLLCSNCNRVIGMMEENQESLRNAADYLERFSGTTYPS